MKRRIPYNRLTRVSVEIAICGTCVAMLFVLYMNPVPIPRHKANPTARANLRNAATAQEAYFVDHGTYCEDVNTLIGNVYGLFLSDGVTLTIKEASPTAYTMTAYHERGNKTFTIKGPGGSVTPY